MAGREPMTQTVKASEARQHWSQLLNSVFRRQTRVIMEKSGVPVAAIISADDLEQLTRCEEQRRERFKALEASWAAFEDVDPEEVERRVARVLAEARKKARQRAEAGR